MLIWYESRVEVMPGIRVTLSYSMILRSTGAAGQGSRIPRTWRNGAIRSFLVAIRGVSGETKAKTKQASSGGQTDSDGPICRRDLGAPFVPTGLSIS